MEDRGWMHLQSRTCEEYLNGLNSFIRAAETDMVNQQKSAISCPCIDCKDTRKFSSSFTVHAHLIIRGFMDGYIIWNHHGEEGLNHDLMWDNQECDEGRSRYHTLGQDGGVGCSSPHGGLGSDEGRDNIDDSLQANGEDLSDEDILRFGGDFINVAANLEEMLRDAVGFTECNEAQFKKLQKLVESMRTPLYPNCKEKYSKLYGSLKLLQLKATHHWTDRSFKALCELLRDMLPEGNEVPKTTYEAKQNICPLGLEVEKIHACKNDCILYLGDDYANLIECPECGTPRYKRRKDGGDEDRKHGAPQKVAWYFPIIARLVRLLATSNDARLLPWHKEGRRTDNCLRHPADSIQWRVFDSKYGWFAEEPRNIRFALSTDGMNPFGQMSSSHSVWPVLLCIYNLPPWLCTKRKYMMMPMLISGPHQPGNDIDVYLRPLVDDLKKLWSEGVEVYDGYKHEHFTLRAMLFCTIGDIPAQRCLSGQCKGEKDCSQCLDDTESLRLNNSKKQVYLRHRRWIPKSHVYRKMKVQFDGTRETAPAPRHFSGEHVYSQVYDLDVTLGKKSLGKRKRDPDGAAKSRWKKKSILWELPYWKDLDVRHSIDFMHITKNVCVSLLSTIMGDKGKTKDHEKGRADLVDMNIRPELCPDGTGSHLPLSAINMIKEEKQEFCEFLRSVKVPSGYSSNIRKLVSPKEPKMLNMKAHDCHVMLTTMLAVGIRNILPEKVRMTIMSLCFFFNAISQKVIDEETLDDLEKNLFLTMCLLEAYFPPSFFDISVHLITHLVKETRYLGPVFLHQMYPYERFMSTLNRYTKSRVHPEGSMVEGYSTEEVVDWCLGYIDPKNPIGISKSRHEGRLAGTGTLGQKTFNPDPNAYKQAHFLVLQHTAEVHAYIDEHKEMLQRENPDRNEVWLARAHMNRFNLWFRNRIHNSESCTDEGIQNLASGPLFTITSYQGYDINGYTFYTIAQDKKSTYQNSGVRIDAYDQNMHKAAYYGQIEEIWELTYAGFKVPIFRCRWVQGKRGVMKGKDGFTSVDLEQVGYKEEPFVLADQVSQVFYVPDTVNKKRFVVLPGKARVVGVENAMEEEEYNQFDEVPLLGKCSLPVILESEKTPYLRSAHKDGFPVQKTRPKGGKQRIQKK